MRKWLAARRARQQQDGFNWAAGMLLKSGGDIEEVEAYIAIYGDGSPFDQGVLEALEAWRNTP